MPNQQVKSLESAQSLESDFDSQVPNSWFSLNSEHKIKSKRKVDAVLMRTDPDACQEPMFFRVKRPEFSTDPYKDVEGFLTQISGSPGS